MSRTCLECIEQNIERFPSKIALYTDEGAVSYQQLHERIDAWSSYLATLGVAAGDRVMITCKHRYDFLAIFLALWKREGVPVPYEPGVAPAELVRALGEARAHWLISENPAHIHSLPADSVQFSSLLQPSWLCAKLPTAVYEVCPSDTALLIYTSGTTGKPKCVIYDHTVMTAIMESLLLAYSLSEDDVVLTPLAPALSATLISSLLPALAGGATLVLPAEPVPGHLLKLINQYHVTIFFAVPYLYDLLSKAMTTRRTVAWESVRLCLSTSAYLPGHIFDAFYGQTDLPIRSIYCTSEANQCTFNLSQNVQVLRDSVGTAQQGVELRIIDQAGQEVPPGTEGQIIVRGTHLSKGYYHHPELEQQVYRCGWVYTGDLGILNNQGVLSLTGRLSDTINISGHLVQPQEVETTLLEHPAVAEALVLGEGDAQVGEQVVGWVVIRPGITVQESELYAHCQARLIAYKVPGRIELVETLPKGRYGKIRRLTPSARQASQHESRR